MHKARNKIINLTLIGLIILMTFLIRVPSFSEPYSRDEGLYAYIADSLPKGDALYKDRFEFKPPGIFCIYSFVQRIFGKSEIDLRLFTAIYSILSTLAIFALASFLYGLRYALLSAFLFGFFSAGPALEGNIADSEIFMILPLIVSAYAFLGFLKKRNKTFLFFSGILTGIAFLFKIVAAFNLLLFIIFLFILYLSKTGDLTTRRLIYYLFVLSGGFIIVQVPVFLYFYNKGTLRDFIYAVFVFGFTYVKSSYGLSYFFRLFSKTALIFTEGFLLWIAGLSATVYILLRDRRQENLFLILWFIFSFFGVAAGGKFYGHYYIQLMPALSLLGGWLLYKIINLALEEEAFDIVRSFIIAVIFGSLFLFFTVNCRYYQNYFSYLNTNISKEDYQGYFKYRNAPSNYKIALYLKNNTTNSDYIFVWGSEPLIYFLSQRNSPVRYLMDFHSTNITGALGEIMKDILLRKPVFIITTVKPFDELEKLIASDYYFDKSIDGVNIYKKITRSKV